jgi:mRNA-degrading endonuclease RelE of RelBE toxin-antitoxin system
MALKSTRTEPPVTPEDRALRHLLYGKKPHVYRIICAIEEDTSTVYVLHIRPPGRRQHAEALYR